MKFCCFSFGSSLARCCFFLFDLCSRFVDDGPGSEGEYKSGNDEKDGGKEDMVAATRAVVIFVQSTPQAVNGGILCVVQLAIDGYY